MSLSERLPYQLARAQHRDGERRAYLVDDRGVEDDYSALFIISTVRNAGRSVASQEAALGAINVLAGWCARMSIDLVGRFAAGGYLSDQECQSLADFAQLNFGAELKRQQRVVALGKVRRGYRYAPPTVERQTHHQRLTHIARFVTWLAKYLSTHTSRARLLEIEAMGADILRRRPVATAKRDDFDDVGFSRQDNEVLNQVIAPGSPKNPFRDELQLRNLLIVELLRQTGIRRGELLNLRVRDVDHVKRQVTILRRQDSQDDPRVDQPLVKTLGRVIPISVQLTDLIVKYVAVRRTVPGATKHRYLFVTHKAGLSQGMPLTKMALREVFTAILQTDERLAHLTPHKLRHLFNNELARHQLEEGTDPNSRESHRRVRNYVAGRQQQSEVDALYTQAETRRQAEDAVLTVQRKLRVSMPRSGERA